jgi:Xaa-Pro aminopeptidase
VPVAVPDPFLYAEVDGKRSVAASSFEVERIEALGTDLEAHPWEEFGWDELLRSGKPRDEILRALWLISARAFGVGDAVVPRTFPLEYADHLRENGIAVSADQRFFDARRRSKSPAEVEGVRRAQRAAEAGLRAGLDLLRRAERNGSGLTLEGAPLTCERLKAAVDQAFGRHGATADESIVSHGAQTAVGHDMGSGAIAPGDIVLFDLFPRDRQSACYADMTRTFVLGEPPDEIREYHRLCKEALDLATAMIGPGVNGRDVHFAVSDFFHEHGQPTMKHKEAGVVLDSGFYHGLGHGVGLEVHERPGLGMTGDELVVGDVITLEPGLYRHGVGGVRLEDLLLVTEDGAEVLTDFPYDLEL